jgi:hypothetical protein
MASFHAADMINRFVVRDLSIQNISINMILEKHLFGKEKYLP